MPLTPKQDAFCHEYIKDSNGKQAAIRAGYTGASAEVEASRLLRIPKVKARVEELRKPIQEAALLTLEDHVKELALLRDMAKDEKQIGAAITAETNRGKAVGLYVERTKGEQDVTVRVRYEDA